MPKSPCPYTYPHRSRAAKVAHICSIGGYYDRHSRWPIEFNVSAHACDFSFDHIWQKYSDEFLPFEKATTAPDVAAAYFALARREYAALGEQQLWVRGQEDAYRSLHDDSFYRSLWSGAELDVTLELQGRGGKHLVIAEFEGMSLRGMSCDDLRDALMRQEDDAGRKSVEHDHLLRGYSWVYSSEFVNLLYRYVRECEVNFTWRTASAAVEECGASGFFANDVYSKWITVLEDMASHGEVVEAARAVKASLVFSTTPDVWEEFQILCRAAGVSEDEVENG